VGNLSKWLIAVPFIGLWTLGLPALIAGRLDWFLATPWDVVFVLLWAGAFAAGTHFYQPARHRQRPGRTRLVFSLATLVVPLLAIYERTHGPAGSRSALWAAVGLGLFLLGAALGVAAWRALGRWYAPDPDVRPGQQLITSGPYRLVRHPMYTALLLALPALPLLLRSLWGLALSLVLIVPALRLRIREEEAMLLTEFGDEYRSYMARTWRLVPFVF